VDRPGRPDYLPGMDTPQTLDARGLLCPLPVLKLRKRLGALPLGTVLEMWADDPAAMIDVPHFCAEAGHEFLGMTEREGYAAFRVRRAG